MAKVYLNAHLEQTAGLVKLVNDLMLLEQTAGNYRTEIIGNWGAFEENPRAMLAGIKKVHVAVSNADFEKWKKKTGQNRKSDNYLIYTQHGLEDDTFLILDFITPDAHQRIKSRLSDLILVAEKFQETYYPKFSEHFQLLQTSLEI